MGPLNSSFNQLLIIMNVIGSKFLRLLRNSVVKISAIFYAEECLLIIGCNEASTMLSKDDFESFNTKLTTLQFWIEKFLKEFSIMCLRVFVHVSHVT